MKYRRIPPSNSLSDHVRYFWVSEMDASWEEPFTYYAVAASSSRLIFHYKGRFQEVTPSGKLISSHSSGIQGQSKTFTQFITGEQVGMFGIEFFPHAIPSLFSIPAIALTDKFIDLRSFLGSRGSELEEQMFLANANEERVKIATHFLEPFIKTSGNAYIIDAIHRINKSGGLINITELMKGIPLSQKHFERLFKEVAGFTPKLYARVLRFETTLNKTGTLTEKALDAGYFDQSHFNRDFKAFSGLQPKHYFKATAHLMNVENVQF